MEINQGNVYITKLERGFYGAFKIIRKGIAKGWEDNETLMIAVLDFIDTKKPTINDLKGKPILLQNRFQMRNELSVHLYTADVRYNNLEKHEFLGNLPITKEEHRLPFALGSGSIDLQIVGKIKGFPMAGTLDNTFDIDAMFYEWLWRNEKEQMVADYEQSVKEMEEKRVQKVMKPKKMMPDDLFWKIIDKIDWRKIDNDEQIEPVIDFLSKQSKKNIREFQENLTCKLYLLDTMEHAKHIGKGAYTGKEDYFSADYFLYVRCCVVANGKAFYEKILKNPKKMVKDMDYEPLLYVAHEAYEKKINEELDYETGCDFETFSNKEGWK